MITSQFLFILSGIELLIVNSKNASLVIDISFHNSWVYFKILHLRNLLFARLAICLAPSGKEDCALLKCSSPLVLAGIFL